MEYKRLSQVIPGDTLYLLEGDCYTVYKLKVESINSPEEDFVDIEFSCSECDVLGFSKIFTDGGYHSFYRSDRDRIIFTTKEEATEVVEEKVKDLEYNLKQLRRSLDSMK